MKIGPIDFNQPSTWRGIVGLVAIGGLSVSPELANQIALFAAGLISLIEMFRNEYTTRSKNTTLPSIALVSSPSPDDQPGFNERELEPLRRVSPESASSPPPGFGDR